jgi:Protein of unknown function (DUF3618)
MVQDPEAIRQQIAETRARMGETVEAIGARADITARARGSVSGLRAEIAGTRARLGSTIDALRQKADVRTRAGGAVAAARYELTEGPRRHRLQAAAAGGVVLAASAVTGAVLGRRALAERRIRRLAGPAAKLPGPFREVALPAARQADRALAEAASRVQRGRHQAMRSVSDEIARALAEEKARRNPFWRRITKDVLTAAATTAATAAVRRALSGRRAR